MQTDPIDSPQRLLANCNPSPPLAMGFPSALPDLALPRCVLHAFYALGFLRNLISALFGLLGLTQLVEYEVSVSSDASDRIRRPGFQSPSAMLIRQFLPVVCFGDLCTEKVMDGCVICLCEFEEEDEIRRLRHCEHVFHVSCLDRWMDCDQKTCPLCRSHLVPEEIREEFQERLWAAEAALYSDGEDPSTWHLVSSL
ncbi:brassinosteroid-responsive RING protein 1-like [Magnolia sinica]|uniref:brassinosteroid-responsive RING protein 1-like n=1 Tax=Magnolia sinica TaxID=86752 RepID=UPI002658A224|nr:brassinosteroid-responsive RING protein 1-like [Magnolia sinica]